jgi:RNA polymerase sigma factor
LEDLDLRILHIRRTSTELNHFILSYENYILKIASKVSKKYISRSDDEWSIALNAFLDAINNYDLSRGHFLPFAELLITRSLIDHFRQETRKPLALELDSIEELVAPETNSFDLIFEIEAITKVLQGYGITFMELTNVSPKAKKTKEHCRLAIAYLVDRPMLIETMRQTKELPIKHLSTSIHLSMKLLERHRKYIIAVTEILIDDYPLLKEYVKN